MRWVLRLIATGDDARCLGADLIEISRQEGVGDIANLGLTLPEAKQLLASVQRAVVSAQAVSHGLQRPCCSACSGKCHLKGPSVVPSTERRLMFAPFPFPV